MDLKQINYMGLVILYMVPICIVSVAHKATLYAGNFQHVIYIHILKMCIYTVQYSS
jgi:hypothetical protein